MRYSLIVGVFVVLAFGLVISTASAQSKAEQELLKIEDDWCAADVKKDAAALGRILASDFTGVGSSGRTQTRESSMADYKDASSATTSCVNKGMKVRIYGDAAVVTGTVVRSGTSKGQAVKDLQILFTDTFVRRDGRWQCVASQGTNVASQQK